jgi:hypothetical protein
MQRQTREEGGGADRSAHRHDSQPRTAHRLTFTHTSAPRRGTALARPEPPLPKGLAALQLNSVASSTRRGHRLATGVHWGGVGWGGGVVLPRNPATKRKGPPRFAGQHDPPPTLNRTHVQYRIRRAWAIAGRNGAGWSGSQWGDGSLWVGGIADARPLPKPHTCHPRQARPRR